MTMPPLRISVIVGSTRNGRFGPIVANWFTGHAARRPDLHVEIVDLADPQPVSATLAAADGFVVVTPEYNHSYPGPLKEAIDAHYKEWHAKPVAFVSYGGISGGLRAVEHLRGVFAELHAMTVRDTVSFHRIQQCFDPQGQPVDRASVDAADVLLNRLTWWANALREARTHTPYLA
ncbi:MULTISPECIES: NAD(P)H-dependent oxidoreductase [Polymorphospora]|uniref:NAD(P)H-dependent oxidoreductase n=1 Tax=Polymorphospora lycopeni TaxID=3140240 RepID=A0ABV5D079_9ACTN